MNQRKINRLLRELTPDALAYLFPGWEPALESPDTPMLGESLVMYDALPGEDFYEETPIQRRERKPREKRKPFFHWDLHKVESANFEDAELSMPSAPAAVPEPEALDPRTEEILAEIRRLQEKYGVSIDELEVMLGYTVKLSRLRITRGGRIYLTDYEDREVKMTNVAKSLYFLYLRHPEGLRFKEIAEHKEELLHIYGNITGRDEPEEIEKSIDILTDPLGNGLNVNASRIKTAFKNVVSDRIARFYYLSGGAGEEKKVPLDRDLVIWEY